VRKPAERDEVAAQICEHKAKRMPVVASAQNGQHLLRERCRFLRLTAQMLIFGEVQCALGRSGTLPSCK
jgi:acetylornithine/succinyldiaminopimelate/putrescine aminotransferase